MSERRTAGNICRYCKDDFQCPDCYFDELSDILEQEPWILATPPPPATDEEVKDLFESK